MTSNFKTYFLLVISIFLFYAGHSQPSRKIDSLLRLLQNNPHDTVKAKLLYRIGGNYEGLGLYDSTYKYARLSNNLSKKTKFNHGLGASCNMMAHYFSAKGMHDSALKYYDTAFYYYKLNNDKVRIAGLYNNVGVIYKKKGNTAKALENYYKSLKLKEELKDSIGIANSCANIGNLYDDNGDTTNGHKYNLRALEIREKIRDLSGLANSYLSEGLYYSWRQNFKKAEPYFRKSLEIQEELGDEEGIAISCYNIGGFYFRQKIYPEAEKLFKKALLISEKNSDPEGIATCNKTLGDLYYAQNRKKEAVAYYEKAYKAALTSNVKDVIYPIAYDLSTSYEDMGDYKNALFYHKEWAMLKDSLFSRENLKKLTSTELKYQHEKERILLQNEQQKKEAIAEAENHKKNIIIICISLFILAVIIFAFILYKRLQENRKQKNVIEQQNKEIVDSIKYAKRIQNTLLAGESFVTQNLPQNFILYKPKDIVSGDFYWATVSSKFGVRSVEGVNPEPSTPNSTLFYLAVCDSTGHGVPGAFMSLLNIGFLNEGINEKKILEPGAIFNYTRDKLVNSISKEGQKDGFDGILVRFETDESGTRITYAAANNKPVVVSNGTLTELDNDRMPVGKGEKDMPFNSFSLRLKKGDMLYLYTDGYADQFGGPKGKKFKYGKLNELLAKISGEEMQVQKEILDTEFKNWKQNLEQVDDVLIIGIKL